MLKLEIEKQALKKEKGSERRLKIIARELADLNEKTKSKNKNIPVSQEML
jgi:hypothetical protein